MPQPQRRLGWTTVLAAIVLVAGAACASGSDDTAEARPDVIDAPTTTITVTTPAPATTVPLDAIELTLTEVATLDEPTIFITRAGDDIRYIGEKRGRLVRLRADDTVDPEPVLDITDLVRNENEQGFLGAAFSPDGTQLYVHYSNRDGDTRVVEYAFDGTRADPASARTLLEVDQPYANHNGGELRFGPDGLLYLGLGDGGSAGDPQDRAQNLDELLGKILRFDPRPSASSPRSVPADNPFVDDPGAQPEVWIYGVRNPWRFSFDSATGDLWIGDVGQGLWEEIDRLPAGEAAGANLGWNRLEGNAPFEGSAPADAVGPVHVASHDDGNCSVTGGEVYRGDAIAGLAGTYLFADYCAGVLTGIRLGPDGRPAETREFDRATARSIVSFGTGPDGEIYLLSQVGGVYRIDAA